MSLNPVAKLTCLPALGSPFTYEMWDAAFAVGINNKVKCPILGRHLIAASIFQVPRGYKNKQLRLVT